MFAFSLLWIFLLCIVSLLFEGFDRKISARMQNRIGPSVLQPLFDFAKLCQKERIIPRVASPLFTIMPYLAVIFSLLAGIQIINAVLFDYQYSGDLVVIIYLLAMPTLLIAIGGFASGNPYATMGASRSIFLLIGNKIPLISALCIAAFKIQTFSLAKIITVQYESSTPLLIQYPSLIIAAFVYFLCIPSICGVVPFDIAEAKTEIIYGSLIEYSGFYLALVKLSKAVLMFNLVFLGSVFFFSMTIPTFPYCYVSFLIAFGFSLGIMFFLTITLPRNLFARVKIDQTYRFYWRATIMLMVISLILNQLGL